MGSEQKYSGFRLLLLGIYNTLLGTHWLYSSNSLIQLINQSQGLLKILRVVRTPTCSFQYLGRLILNMDNLIAIDPQDTIPYPKLSSRPFSNRKTWSIPTNFG
jgi:hypothetical protein